MTSIDIMPFLKGFSEIHAYKLLKRVSKRIVNNQMLIILTMTLSDWIPPAVPTTGGCLTLPSMRTYVLDCVQAMPEFPLPSEHHFIDCSAVPCGASLCDWAACRGPLSHTTEQGSSQLAHPLPVQGCPLVPACLKQWPLPFWQPGWWIGLDGPWHRLPISVLASSVLRTSYSVRQQRMLANRKNVLWPIKFWEQSDKDSSKCFFSYRTSHVL